VGILTESEPVCPNPPVRKMEYVFQEIHWNDATVFESNWRSLANFTCCFSFTPILQNYLLASSMCLYRGKSHEIDQALADIT